jgi:hypothetical protein
MEYSDYVVYIDESGDHGLTTSGSGELVDARSQQSSAARFDGTVFKDRNYRSFAFLLLEPLLDLLPAPRQEALLALLVEQRKNQVYRKRSSQND